jgi:hypothetical protein
MYKFIKNILKRKEPDKIILAFDAIPAWLNNHAQRVRTSLETETDIPVQKIRNATAQLQHIVNGIADAEHDPAIHPKLKTIAKNSLPLFVKAMNASLSREFPEDVEDFYSAIVECVKGCLNSTRGQGRYLQVVFPDEMKAVKTGIDSIGREINLITTSLTTYRKQKTLINSIQSLHDALEDIRTDYEKSLEKNRRISVRITEITNRIAAIEKELTDCSSDARMKEVNEKRSVLLEMEKQRDNKTQTYTTLSMTASHVFRKAEKIATKKRQNTEISTLRHTISLLSDHTPPDKNDLSSALTIACPIVQRMVADGDISLKNKEERAIFSDTGRFCTDMFTICMDISTQELACKSIQDSLLSDPVLIRMDSLEREKKQLEYMLDKEIHAQKDLEEWKKKIKEKVPVLQKELYNKIDEFIGEGVQLQIDDWMKD